mmetsp:Transcript_20596/g.64850  ORF Transcript_20596/g.64850 Transcript_20596/m.64850 type:complete len:207 (-) Transcript_20596:94-714(-)
MCAEGSQRDAGGSGVEASFPATSKLAKLTSIGVEALELGLTCGESSRTALSRLAALGLSTMLSSRMPEVGEIQPKVGANRELPPVLEHGAAAIGETPAEKGDRWPPGPITMAVGDCQKLTGVKLPELADMGVPSIRVGSLTAWRAGAGGQTAVRHAVVWAFCGVATVRNGAGAAGATGGPARPPWKAVSGRSSSCGRGLASIGSPT